MLFKLMKYEIKASARTLVPLYIAILVLSAVLAVGFSGILFDTVLSKKENTFFGLLSLLLFGLYVALGVLTILSVIQRFNNNLLGDEGYLMFTLPIKSTTLLTSKLLAAMFWSIMAGVIGFLSMTLMFGIAMLMIPEIDFWNEVTYMLRHITVWISGDEWLLLFKLALLSIVSLSASILTAYLAMMIGQLQKFANHRIVVSFIAFFVIGWLYNLITSPIAHLVEPNYLGNTTFMFVNAANEAMWIGLGIVLFQAVSSFFIVNYMMNKHLNL